MGLLSVSFFFFKQKTAYDMRISDWSSDVCSSDLTRDLLMRVTQNLGGACFDKTDCTTCPFNSAAQRTLFETHVDDGHCTNPGCFQLKTEAWEAAQIGRASCRERV